MEDKIVLKRFPIETIPYDCVGVMIAKRNTGKSFLCKDILSHFSDIPVGVVISLTEKKSPFFSKFMPNEFIFDDFNPGVISNIYERQDQVIKKYGKDIKNFDSRCFILMDDCIANPKFFKDTGIRDVFMNGRHSNLMFLMTTQDCMAIPSQLRTNIDYTFILRETRIIILEKIYKHHASVIPTFDMFRYMMNEFTANFGVLVINNKSQTGKLEDSVFYYKAQEHPELQICRGKAWNFHKKRYNPDYLNMPKDAKQPFYDKKEKKVINIIKGKEKKQKANKIASA